MTTATEREYARLGRLLAERRAAVTATGCEPPTWAEHAAALDTSVRSLQRADRWWREHGAAGEAAPAMVDHRRATLAALDRRADVLTDRLERLATAEHAGAAHELVAVCKALTEIDAATADLLAALPAPAEPTAKVARRELEIRRDESQFRARLRDADPAELRAALREAASQLRAEAADLDARTKAEACDLADELQEAPLGGVWPETLAVLREADPEGAEALATAADAFDRAIERAPDPEAEPEPPPDPLAGLPPIMFLKRAVETGKAVRGRDHRHEETGPDRRGAGRLGAPVRGICGAERLREGILAVQELKKRAGLLGADAIIAMRQDIDLQRFEVIRGQRVRR